MVLKQCVMVAVCVGALALGACDRTGPIYNVMQEPVPVGAQKKLTQEQVGQVIAKTVIAKGYTVSQTGQNSMQCTMHWREHEAITTISYSKSSYTITLVRSDNLMQTDGMIHHVYNDRIVTLRTAIDRQLAQAAYD